MAGKVAVVLFNLGGPDTPGAVRPFLFNLFHDPAIIGLPQPLRWLVAALVARRRAPIAGEIYAKLGGGSPLLPETERQAAALQARLRGDGIAATVFVCMRYWHPLSRAVAAEVAALAPDTVLLLPLYPQFSTTTTASSVADWRRAAGAAGLTAPTRTVCCYPEMPGLAVAIAELLATALAKVDAARTVRVLFSAHGLPKRVVARGDPYPLQVAATARAIVGAVNRPGLDHVVCYQSRVGPLEWIEPSIDAELIRAAADGIQVVVVVPIAFVSEHSETLVELDLEYRARAAALGITGYVRVPTVSCHPAFIAGLAAVALQALETSGGPSPASEQRFCPAEATGCPCLPSTPPR